MPSLIILEVVEEPLLQDAEFKQLLALLDSLNVTLILTSRKRAVIGLGENIVDLGGMSDSEALEFLMRESGRFSNIEQNTQEMILLEEIITLLGGHSLAIRVLSGYLRQNPNIGLAEILKQLKGNQS